MKTFLYISLVGFLTFSFCSCSEWLDVQPKTEVKQDKMFESESGFKDALIGCYMLMGESSLYGQELTYTFLEVLAQQYDFVNSFHPYQQAKLYSYSTSSVETKINTIWSKTYRVIANLNAILENLSYIIIELEAEWTYMHGEDGTVVLLAAIFQLSIDEVKVRNRTGVIELESIGIQTNEFDAAGNK